MKTKIIVWLIIIALTGIGATLKFSTSHESMPIGCDEFGYLNLAKELGNIKRYSEPFNEELISPLVDTLLHNGISNNEIIWMVTPHAYHLQVDSKNRINQYPPATSFLLKLLPISYRKILFPLLVIVMLILPVLLFVFIKNTDKFTLAELILLFLIFIFTVTSPFLTELTRVNSVAPTFGLLICAGYLLFRQPFVSLILIALSVNFRVANIILLLPVFSFFIYNYRKGIDLQNVVKGLAAVVLSLLPILYYQYLVFGNPFTSTYSVIDKSFISFDQLLNSIGFYFNLSQQWLVVHLITIAILLFFLFIRKINGADFLKLLMIPILNYVFFIVHEVKMDYYPYASAMMLLGVALSFCNEITVRKRWAYTFIIAVTLTVLISGFKRYIKRDHITGEEARSKYSILCDYKIVWGDLYTGTTEYVCGNYGFRYGTTTPRARIIAMQYLRNRNTSQIILISDNTVVREDILNDLKIGNLKFRMSSDQFIGDFIIID